MEWLRVLCFLSSGLLSWSDVCVLVYVTGQFVRMVTVSRYGTFAFPQSFTSDLSSFSPKLVQCVCVCYPPASCPEEWLSRAFLVLGNGMLLSPSKK